MFVEDSPHLAVALALLIMAQATLPNFVRVGTGQIVRLIVEGSGRSDTAAAMSGLTTAVLIVGLLYIGQLLLGPAYWLVTSLTLFRLTHRLRHRLMVLIGGLQTVSPLESTKTLNELALAQGSLLGYGPASAPAEIGQVVGYRLSGLVAAAVVWSFAPWLAVIHVAFWLIARQPIRNIVMRTLRTLHNTAEGIRRSEYFYRLCTTPGAAKEVRLFGLGRWLIDRQRASWYAATAQIWKTKGSDRVVVAVVLVAVTLLYGATYLLLGWFAYRGTLSVSALAVLAPLIPGVQAIANVSAREIEVEMMVASMEPLRSLRQTLTTPSGDRRDATTALDYVPRSDIQFRGVAFAYPGTTRLAISDLNLKIRAGQCTALVGPNGAGKTTVVKLLSGLYEPTAGSIVVDDVDLSEFDVSSWRRNLSVLFQDFVKYPFSLLDNVGFGSVEHLSDMQGIAVASEKAGVVGLANGYPEGWHTLLSREFTGGVEPSGGEWQRIGLARALFAVGHGATTLVLDEPTAALDARAEADFYGRFIGLTRGLTTLIVSHRFSTVRLANHICVLEGGTVIESGTHDNLVERGGLYAKMFRLQAAGFVSRDSE